MGAALGAAALPYLALQAVKGTAVFICCCSQVLLGLTTSSCTWASIISNCHDLPLPCTVTCAISRRSMQVTVHTVAAGRCMGHNAHQTTCFSSPQSFLILLGELISLSSIDVVCKKHGMRVCTDPQPSMCLTQVIDTDTPKVLCPTMIQRQTAASIWPAMHQCSIRS